MVRVLCVCGNGMGTSTILKINLKKIATKYNVNATIESCAAGEAMGYINSCDLVISSPEWSKLLPPSNAKVVTTKNLIDVKELDKTFITAIEQYFPEELNK